MEHFGGNKTQQDHVAAIFQEYTTPSRVLRSFTNLSNTVIQTALSGQSKFIFEILQNADDAFENESGEIEVHFILQDNYLIVHHNGKGFDYNDVERICDYASQIEEVKSIDLSKTGYKGLGFKSLFNLSDCIYIISNGYSFRFDKTYWPDSESKPWQVIPIWCKYNELPLREEYLHDKPVNFILKVNDINHIENQLKELVGQPELLLYLNRINKLGVTLNGAKHRLERKIEKFGLFQKVAFYRNQHLESTWLSKTYNCIVPKEVQTLIQGASRFIYPDKIKKAKEIPFTFSLQSDDSLKEISRIRGQFYSTLPTQLHVLLPYHVNCIFILNLDRTQLHENEWNEFLLYQLGYLQLILLKDLAGVPYLRNYVIELYARKITHPYATFCKAFLKGFMEARNEISWLPAYHGSHLLKLGEAWSDETEFFKQNFKSIRDLKIFPYLISYDVIGQKYLSSTDGEVKYFTYYHLFKDFPDKYYPQLTKGSYVNFISFLYERLKDYPPNSSVMGMLKHVHFLRAKDETLVSPKNALLEVSENPVPDFSMLNPVDNVYFPLNNTSLIKDWLVLLGARQLKTPIQILRESVLKWIDSGSLDLKINMENHIEIINYLARNADQLTRKEIEKIQDKLLILTECNQFKLAKLCYLPEAAPIKEVAGVISKEEKISSTYDISVLKEFFIHVGVHDKLHPAEVLRKSILIWIKSGEINKKLNLSNYKPIIEFVASHYFDIEHSLAMSEIKELEKIPVLTCSQTFQKAQNCYFDTAIPKIKGLEYAIVRNKLVSTKDISNSLYKFLLKIGVSVKIEPLELIRRSVLKWIQEGVITYRITRDNHLSILMYISENWITFNQSGLKPKEKDDLKKIPILTKGNTFRAACNCYWPPSKADSHNEEIPGLEFIISPDEFVSSDYPLEVIKGLLEHLGVHNLGFTDIYEKYSEHLNHLENVKWFFTQLINYWLRNKAQAYKDEVLIFVQEKFSSSPCLLAKNGRMYYSTQLYSSQFTNMHDIDKNSVPLLAYEKLPDELEKWLGFKMNLDLKCIIQLLKSIEKNPELGNKKFFVTMLEQLRLRDKNEIKKYQFSLMSSKNKLRPAKDLYYFKEDDSTCVLDYCYLKRIHGMSHEETLELAELCGVNILPFDVKVELDKKTYDSTLKEFYLERLPFIVFKESKELNESPRSTLERLYDKLCSIELYQCSNICVQYPFGNLVKIPMHFANLTFCVLGKWSRWEYKSKIHNYIQRKLFNIDITEIIDMNPNSEADKQVWLHYLTEEDQEQFHFIEELQKCMSNQEKLDTTSFENVCVDQASDSGDSNENSSDSVLSPNRRCIPSEYSDDDTASFIDQLSNSADSDENCSDSVLSGSRELISSENSSDDTLSFVDHDTCLQPQPAVKAENLTVESSSDESSVGFAVSEHTVQIQHGIKTEDITSVESFLDESVADLNNNMADLQAQYTIKAPELSNTESADKNSVNLFEDEHCLQTHNTVNEYSSGVPVAVIGEPVGAINCETAVNFVGSMSKDIIEVDVRWIVPKEQGSDHGMRIQEQRSFHVGYSSFFERAIETTHMKWLSEKYVFTHLQDHYKNKYPTSHFNFLDGLFVLQCESQTIEIIWLNESVDKGYSYDILLKVNGEIKRFIDVKLVNAANYNLSRLGHRNFIEKINQLVIELPHHKEIHEKPSVKWLSENYVFTFLQAHYRNKYLNSQFNVLDGQFKLQWESHNIEVIWLNENEDKKYPYDLLLRKDGEVKQLIKVKSSNIRTGDSFEISHYKFIEEVNQLAIDMPELREKYCIYYVFYSDYSLKSSFEQFSCFSALYKILPLKNN